MGSVDYFTCMKFCFAGHEHMEPCNMWHLTLLFCIQYFPINFCASNSTSVVPAKQLMNALNLKGSAQSLYAI